MLYWNKKGQWQATYDALCAAWIPSFGECDNADAEVLRLATRVYYDLYNNGGGNLVDVLNPEYQGLFEGLKRYGYTEADADELVEAVKMKFRGEAEHYTPNIERCGRAFDRMMDFVVAQTYERLRPLTPPFSSPKPSKYRKPTKLRSRSQK